MSVAEDNPTQADLFKRPEEARKKLACAECGVVKWPSKFARTMLDGRPAPTCLECGGKRWAAKRAHYAEGMRQCADCSRVRPRECFVRGSCYCLGCSARRQKERKARLLAEATHFSCRICKQEKPRAEFRFCQEAGRRRVDLRCLECNAKRARMGRTADSTKYHQAKGIAKRRGMEFTLAQDEFLSLRAMPCRYCGGPIPASGSGLDRQDNDKGYETGNVVPCCWPCNQARGSIFTPEEMLLIGAVIARIRKAREETGAEPLASNWGRPKKYG